MTSPQKPNRPDTFRSNKEGKERKKPETKYASQRTYAVTTTTTLLPFLIATFPEKSKTTIKSYLSHKQVAINHCATTQFDAPLNVGDVVVIDFEKSFYQFRHSKLRIVFEDEDLIVVEKANGLLSMATDGIKEKTAYHILSEYLKKSDPTHRIFILHRLDRETSGLMIYAKNKEVQSLMQANWDTAIRDRRYVAVVEGKPAQERGIIQSYLTENKAYKVYATHNNEGQLAITRYSVLSTNGKYSLLELDLETGRKNQIRAHMEEIGNPIVGDLKYGGTTSPIGRMALHAYKLAFQHPMTRKEMTFETPIPKAFSLLAK